MLNVKSVDEVMKIISNQFSEYRLSEEFIDIREGANRVNSQNIFAAEDIPGFNRSSVDGYAVVSSDTFGSSDSLPSQLKLAGEVKMGEKPDFSIECGKAAYVPTGGELPLNADSVVMIEYTDDLDDGFIYINKPSAPGSNIILKGDDARMGNLILGVNHRLRPQDIGALAAMGHRYVSVKRKINVGIISTGDELIDADKKPVGSQVRDVNSYTLYSGILENGGNPISYGIIQDDFIRIKAAVEAALKECDIVLVSGGSSVGVKDETYRVINSIGDPGVLVHGIAVKPGKPAILGKAKGKAIVGLPGHPASAYFIFKIFVIHLINTMNQFTDIGPRTVKAEMACNYPSNNGREEFVPVRLARTDGKLIASPVFGKSGLIMLLTSCDGYVRISRGSEGISANENVEVILF